MNRCAARASTYWTQANSRGLSSSNFHNSTKRTGDVIQAGDRVLIRRKDKNPFMTKPLDAEGKLDCLWGSIYHSELIGKKSRDTIRTSKDIEVRVHVPTLAEYVTIIAGKVAPIYPSDANLIVSLLDIHLEPPSTDNPKEPFEILEIGTGNGALTIHLARAVHAANVGLSSTKHDLKVQERPAEAAIVHTLDISEGNSRYARKFVDGFRRGMYTRDVHFHVGDTTSWLDDQRRIRGLSSEDEQPFLSHIISDIPNTDHIAAAASALHVDGSLLVFNPSISQIMSVVNQVKNEYLPFELDRILELTPNFTGGKEWDVRSVRPRSFDRAASAVEAERGTQSPEEVDNQPSLASDPGWKMVCRPKTGYYLTGGGFVGLWKKMKH